MANEEHLAQLGQGVKAWNEWRIQNRGIRPDFTRANLTGANLFDAYLDEADLSQANLTRASLA
jgi:uncharacterized protein YjbI with pentapeptide repeats